MNCAGNVMKCGPDLKGDLFAFSNSMLTILPFKKRKKWEQKLELSVTNLQEGEVTVDWFHNLIKTHTIATFPIDFKY